MPVILGNEQVEIPLPKAETLFCKPKAAAKRCRELIAAAGIPEQILLLPDEENRLETDIFKYQGDIFRSNFKYRANHSCLLKKGEINYVLGLEPPDTFSLHYCDYSSDLIQYSIAQKLQRWTVLHPILTQTNGPCTYQTTPLKRQSDEICGPVSTCATIDILLDIPEACKGGTLTVEINSNYGFSGNLIFFEDGKVVK